MTKRWDDTRKELESLVFKDGASNVARDLHANRATVYRLINGQTQRPSGALRAAVENIVASATDPDDTISGKD